jgi:DNA-binding response OmpR family regulator
MVEPHSIRWSGARALVVDDDSAVRDYVSTLLRRDDILTDVAQDGMEAEAKLRTIPYNLLFLDLDLPGFSGKFLLELIKRGKAHRPNFIVVMSGAPNIAHKVGDDWTRLGVTDFLAKPFGASDIQSFLDRTLKTVRELHAGTVAMRSVLMCGAGPWAAALLRLVRRAGGAPLAATTDAEARTALVTRPDLVVVGPPFDDGGTIGLCVRIRDSLPTTQILVATEHDDASTLRADLLRLGVVRTIHLPKGLAWLSGEMVRIAGLQPRPARTSLQKRPILLRGPDGVRQAEAIELFETGLSVELEGASPAAPVACEFELPGDGEMFEASLEADWSRPSPGGRANLGFRFVGMTEPDQERLRNYLLLSDQS